jgi:RNA polymerase sigma factor (sigma-70 family)
MAIDSSEFAQLWNAYAASLTLLARARCQAAEDCVQEAFIKLSRQPHLPREPIAWLSHVVRNEAISHWRSESRRVRREATAADTRRQWFASASYAQTDPIDRLALQQALEQLEVDDREIVIAHLWTGLTFRQIAASFELPLAQVHRRYQQSLHRLRVAIEGESHRSPRPAISAVAPSSESELNSETAVDSESDGADGTHHRDLNEPCRSSVAPGDGRPSDNRFFSER